MPGRWRRWRPTTPCRRGCSACRSALTNEPGMKDRYLPLALVPALAALALPFVGSLPTWVTLTVAGLAMGMMIFMMASGLTLVFGLMDVLNFAHGVFISFGAYGAATVLTRMSGAMQADSLASDLSAMLPAVAAAIALAALLGWF